MSKIVFILLLFSCCFGLAQSDEDVFSVYFSSGLVTGSKSLEGVAAAFYGTYSLIDNNENALRNAAGDLLKIDDSGVYIEKNKLLAISRTEVRENSQYIVKNGYLFGVSPNDSVLTALQGESYYFLVPAKTYLFEQKNPETTLFKGLNGAEYIILSKEEERTYSATYLQFTNGIVTLKELDLNHSFYDLRTVTEISVSTSGAAVYRVNPSAKEWKKIMNCFVTYDSYALVPSN